MEQQGFNAICLLDILITSYGCIYNFTNSLSFSKSVSINRKLSNFKTLGMEMSNTMFQSKEHNLFTPY